MYRFKLFTLFTSLVFNFSLQSKDLIESELEILNSSLISLNSTKDLNDSEKGAKVLSLLKDLKEDLSLERNRLDSLKTSFLNLCSDFRNSNLPKKDKQDIISKDIKDLNLLLNSNNLLDKELKEKINLFNKLINLFLNSENINIDDLDVNLASINQIINTISDLLNDKSVINNTLKSLDDDVLDMTLKNDIDGLEVDSVKEVYEAKDFDDENLQENDIVLKDSEEESEEDIDINKKEENQSKIVKYKTRLKDILDRRLPNLKSSSNEVLNAVRDMGDYRMGGYPMQFVHQLVQNMDKVYNR